jgi:hypothetical protein
MELYLLDNGKMVRDMAVVNNIGQMVHFMKVIGIITWQMVRVD